MEEAQVNLSENTDALRMRLREMYKRGNVNYLEVILNSRDIEELLRNNEIISSIARADRELIEFIQEQIDTIKETEERLQIDKAKVSASKAAVENERQSYQAAVDAKNNYMKVLESNLDWSMPSFLAIFKYSAEIGSLLNLSALSSKVTGQGTMFTIGY